MSVDSAFARLYEIIVVLRSPDGCPWDREQTGSSLRRHLIEETYETIDAIDSGDPDHVSEELGDLMLLIVMIARIYEESSHFSVVSVVERIAEKLVRRHPHVFSDATVESSQDVIAQWQEIKETQEGRTPAAGALGSVSQGIPPLDRANELQKAAARVGFDWPTVVDVIAKMNEEVGELQELLSASAAPAPDEIRQSALEEEVGDILFSAVNIARFLKIDPSVALNRTNRKFTQRFGQVERQMSERNLPMGPDTADLMNEIWDTYRK